MSIKVIDRADGKRFQVYGRRNGRKVYVGTFDSKREAESAERRHVVTQEQIAAGELPPEHDLKRTLADALDDWIASLEARGSRSAAGYAWRVKIYIKPALGDVSIARFNKPHAMKFRDEQAVKLRAGHGQREPDRAVLGVLLLRRSAVARREPLPWGGAGGIAGSRVRIDSRLARRSRGC